MDYFMKFLVFSLLGLLNFECLAMEEDAELHIRNINVPSVIHGKNLFGVMSSADGRFPHVSMPPEGGDKIYSVLRPALYKGIEFRLYSPKGGFLLKSQSNEEEIEIKSGDKLSIAVSYESKNYDGNYAERVTCAIISHIPSH